MTRRRGIIDLWLMRLELSEEESNLLVDAGVENLNSAVDELIVSDILKRVV